MEKEMQKELTVLVKGHSDWNGDFETKVHFKLERYGGFQYGNKMALIVEQEDTQPRMVDVRYLKFKDIKELAKIVLEDFFGDNMKSYKVIKA